MHDWADEWVDSSPLVSRDVAQAFNEVRTARSNVHGSSHPLPIGSPGGAAYLAMGGEARRETLPEPVPMAMTSVFGFLRVAMACTLLAARVSRTRAGIFFSVASTQKLFVRALHA